MSDDAKATEWFLKDGSPYDGDAFEDDKGKPFGEITIGCGKCGGSGRWRRGRAKGDCFACEGVGSKFEQVRLYTEPEIDRLAAQRAKRQEAKLAEERERQHQRELAAVGFRENNAELLLRAEARRSNKFVADLLYKLDEWGSLTGPQTSALVRALDRMDEDERLYANSKELFGVGERVDIEVLCRNVNSFFGKKFKGKGTQQVFITEMIDADGNAIIAVTPNFTMEEGDRALLRGTVKGYDDRRGWASTVLTRVKVIEPRAAMETERTAPSLSM